MTAITRAEYVEAKDRTTPTVLRYESIEKHYKYFANHNKPVYLYRKVAQKGRGGDCCQIVAICNFASQ